MYKDVTEEFVVNVIKTQTKMIAQIHKELLKIFSSSGNDDLITAATFHSELHEATSKTNAKHDLHDVYEQYRKINYEWDMSVKSYARELVEKLESINRIIACYNNLKQKEKLVLDMLYIQRNFKEGKVILDKEHNIPERTALRIRKTAIDNILKMYYSSSSNLELYKVDKNKNNKYR